VKKEAPKLERKKRVTARVLAVVPGPSVNVYLTLQKHLIDWDTNPEDLSGLALGSRLEAQSLDFVPKYGCRVRCMWPEKSKGPTIGFCPLGRLTDKGSQDAKDSVDVGTKMSCRVIVTRRPYDLKEDTIVSVTELSLGQLVVGRIDRVVDFGIFVKLSEYVNGLVHLRQLTDVPLASVPKKFTVDTKVKCRVLRVFPEKQQVTLTAKKSLVKDDFQLCEFEQARKDMLVTGYVSAMHPYGAIVNFYGDTHGLLPQKHLDEDTAPAVGMSVLCRISEVNRKRKRLGLSLDIDGGKAAGEFTDDDKTSSKASTMAYGDICEVVRAVRCTETGVCSAFQPSWAVAAHCEALCQ